MAEDDPRQLSEIETVLGREGFVVVTARNGQEALDYIEGGRKTQESFHLLVTDIVMPGMDGIELLEALQNRRIVLPAIAISTMLYEDCRVVLQLRGCRDFLEKPFTSEELIGMVTRTVNGGPCI